MATAAPAPPAASSAPAAAPPQLDELHQRFAAVATRIRAAEETVDLYVRFRALEARLSAVERRVIGQAPAASAVAAAQAQAQAEAEAEAEAHAEAEASRRAAYEAALAGASPIQARLAKEMYDRGFSQFRFVRVPPEYYDRPLEFRRGCLGAASVHHLCKSIIMENTRAHPSVRGWEDPNNSKYYLVVVQYMARLNADKLKAHIHRLNGGRVAKQYFNMRLCPEDVSDKLSGYEHNAVTPIGIATPLPVVLSHRVAALDPPFFFLGAGEVDLKVGMPAAEFARLYGAMVVDCTYEDEEEGGGGAKE